MMKDKNRKQNPKNTNEQQLFLETRNGNIRSRGKPQTHNAEEDYCNEATQGRPLTHSQSHQAQNITKHTEVKQRMAWTKEDTREVIWCYMYNISQQTTRRCMKYGGNEIQNAERTRMQRNL
jgi:hypothetical protein